MQASQELNGQELKVSAAERVRNSIRKFYAAILGVGLWSYTYMASAANPIEDFLKNVSLWMKSTTGVLLASVIGAGFAIGLMLGKVRIWMFLTYLGGVLFFFGAENMITAIRGWSGTGH